MAEHAVDPGEGTTAKRRKASETKTVRTLRMPKKRDKGELQGQCLDGQFDQRKPEDWQKLLECRKELRHIKNIPLPECMRWTDRERTTPSQLETMLLEQAARSSVASHGHNLPERKMSYSSILWICDI